MTTHKDDRDTIKVAQVLAGAERGGAENFYTRLVAAMSAVPGLRQKAFLRDFPDRTAQLDRAAVDWAGFRFGGALDLIDRHRYRSALAQFAPDVVLTWMGRASAVTPRGNYRLVHRLGHYYKLKYYRKGDYWIGISKGICDHLINGGMPADKVVHIPNFADETAVTPLPRDSFDTPGAAPLLLAAGRLHVNKGFDILLQALTRIPEAHLWLAGSGPEETTLRGLADELGVTSRVHWLGWRTDVTALMRSADVFICPSRHEGLGSIVMESWAHKCPILATASQGPAELIDDSETGLVTPIDDVDALADAVNQLLGSSGLREKLAANAFAHYRKHYSKDTIVERYWRFFNTIL
ncbi:glycosyltransferase [Exilibacterium tricleocarpae]|uniref:Glycosyltransferase n=1 Tax=Exilibacterium tricleocarpae TaxID=2591008 RepID=A0A545TKB7_9GAMM|nr:glycosyltransferase [Exilibacterium tricleocarpae]TQV77648.1 glycosyltransferase [Exilibacterium tricleocarpae]